MLVLSRKRGETIYIDENIVVTVLNVTGNRVQLGLEAPASVRIRRGELPESAHKVASGASQSEREVCHCP
jgi:carbon storage regulator